MKKSKLIASLCTLILTLACLTFGVYSAVKTTFTASGTITFNSYECNFDVRVTATNLDGADKVFYGTNFVGTTARENFSTGSALVSGVKDLRTESFDLQELAVPELDETKPNLVLIRFEFFNYSKTQIEATANFSSINQEKFFYSEAAMCLLEKSDGTTATTGEFTIEIRPKMNTAISSADAAFTISSTVKSIEEVKPTGQNSNVYGYGQASYVVDKSAKTCSVSCRIYADDDGVAQNLDGTNVIASTVFGYTLTKVRLTSYYLDGSDCYWDVKNIPYGTLSFSVELNYSCPYIPYTCETITKGDGLYMELSSGDIVVPEKVTTITCTSANVYDYGGTKLSFYIYSDNFSSSAYSGEAFVFTSFEGKTYSDVKVELGSKGKGVYTYQAG